MKLLQKPQCKQKNRIKSINPYLPTEYLAGRFKFNEADSQAESSSSELENNSDDTDDAKVFGGSSSPKAIKKSK